MESWNRQGRKTLRRNYARRFRYTPFSVGAALIWAALRGVKRKIANVRRPLLSSKKAIKPMVLLWPVGLFGINM